MFKIKYLKWKNKIFRLNYSYFFFIKWFLILFLDVEGIEDEWMNNIVNCILEGGGLFIYYEIFRK